MALAYATDLATGHSRDFALRSCVLGMRFADVAGLDQDTRRRIYHQALLRYIGCNADTHLAAHWGDEITLRRDLHHILDDCGGRELKRALRADRADVTVDAGLLPSGCACCGTGPPSLSGKPMTGCLKIEQTFPCPARDNNRLVSKVI